MFFHQSVERHTPNLVLEEKSVCLEIFMYLKVIWLDGGMYERAERNSLFLLKLIGWGSLRKESKGYLFSTKMEISKKNENMSKKKKEWEKKRVRISLSWVRVD